MPQTPSDVGIPLDDLQEVLSKSKSVSQSGQSESVEGHKRSEQSSLHNHHGRLHDPLKRISAIQLGVRDLFLGSHLTSHSRSRSHDYNDLYSLDVGESSKDVTKIPLQPETTGLDYLKAGLDEALGVDGKGQWLSSLDNDTTSTKALSITSIDANDILPARPDSRNSFQTLRPDQQDLGNFPSILNEDSTTSSMALGGKDSFQMTSIELRPHTPDLSVLPPATASVSPVHQISQAVKNISSRVITGNNDDRTDDYKRQRSKSPSKSLLLTTNVPLEPTGSLDNQSLSLGAELSNVSSYQSSTYSSVPLISQKFDPTQLYSHPITTSTVPSSAFRPQHPLPKPKVVLSGRSLKCFGPSSKTRLILYQALHQPWVEPTIFVLIIFQTILLSIEAQLLGYNSHMDFVRIEWGSIWTDYAMLALFLVYTAELAAKIIAYGLYDDSDRAKVGDKTVNVTSEIQTNRSDSVVLKSFSTFFRFDNSYKASSSSPSSSASSSVPLTDSLSSPTSSSQPSSVPLVIMPERAFLRSSWNRVDFISVISYWLSLLLAIDRFDILHETFVFRFLSCLRILRLLNLTPGTASILRSFKNAARLLVNVAIFIGFFWLLFAIIGVQSFKSSLRRTCVWVDNAGIQDNYTTSQYCGSQINNLTGIVEPYVYTDGGMGTKVKGFTCPVNSFCVSDSNPYQGTVSFDNIFNSLELVFVVMSSNTFTDIMYYTMDSDYLVASLFFIAGTVVLYFWLINLLIAVIVSSFKLAREELARQGAQGINGIFTGFKSNYPEHLSVIRRHIIGRIYCKMELVWFIIIFINMIVLCGYEPQFGPYVSHVIIKWEIFTYSVFLFELLWRFACYMPHWKFFFTSKRNILDLMIVIATTVLLSPRTQKDPIVYGWLSIFRIARFYRIVVAIPFAKDLWSKVLGNVTAILNLTLFYFLLIFLCSLLASRLLKSVIPYESDGDINYWSFFNLGNAFLGMYVVSSTENWTDILYSATENSSSIFSRACLAAFFIGWFIISSFITVNLFIAVITENLEIPEQEKRREQIKAFVREYARNSYNSNYVSGGVRLIRRVWYRKKESEPQSSNAVFDLLLNRHVVEDFLEENKHIDEQAESSETSRWWNPLYSRVKKLFSRDKQKNPFTDSNRISGFQFESGNPTEIAQEFLDSTAKREKTQRRYLEENPKYNISLLWFKPSHPARRFCQRIVAPSVGVRYDGVNPNPLVWHVFSMIMLAATVALVVCASVVTPLYYRQYVELNGFSRSNWIILSDGAFVLIFSIESIIKIIADGLYNTPNAYLRSSWGAIDFFVLCTLWCNFISEILANGYSSRFIRAFKALRALRLLSISPRAQQTFHNVVIVGLWKILGAAFISFCLLFPFSIWALNIFGGRLYSCTDSDNNLLAECIDEYAGSPFNWDVWMPRAVLNPYFNFDAFGGSFAVMFKIISIDGWVDVLKAVTSIAGVGLNSQTFASNGNGVFFVAYNILGTIFILTVFVAVIIRNYSQLSGTAYLTENQKSWKAIERLLRMVKPSVRPARPKLGKLRLICYEQTINPRSFVNRIGTAVLLGLLVLLMVEFYPEPYAYTIIRMLVVLLLVTFHEMIMLVKLYGLGIRSFLQRRWDLYGLVTSTGGFVYTVVAISNNSWSDMFYSFHKLFLVSMIISLLPSSRRFDQLMKTASASLPEVSELLITWFTLFMVYAIAFNQVFGLTKLGPSGSGNANFRTVPKALILLFRMSCGEGWANLLDDYLIESPYCIDSDNLAMSDCGNKQYAYVLFISWNIFSMYIFVNIFVSLIYENFSFVSERNVSQINRSELRKFKQAWYKFDPDATGYIAASRLHEFLRTLDGYFSMKIYDGMFSVPSILQEINRSDREEVDQDVDVDALRRVIDKIPGDFYREKRRLYDKFCAEALLQADEVKGISFTKLLIQFPLYKDMDENKCLTLDKFLERQILIKELERRQLQNKLKGFLEMIYLQRAFDAHQRDNLNPFDDRYISRRPKSIPSIRVGQFEDDQNANDDDEVVRGRHPVQGVYHRPDFGNQFEYGESTSVSIPGWNHLTSLSPPRLGANVSPTRRDQGHRANRSPSPDNNLIYSTSRSPTRSPARLLTRESSPFPSDEDK